MPQIFTDEINLRKNVVIQKRIANLEFSRGKQRQIKAKIKRRANEYSIYKTYHLDE